jgi:hypothetical protein
VVVSQDGGHDHGDVLAPQLGLGVAKHLVSHLVGHLGNDKQDTGQPWLGWFKGRVAAWRSAGVGAIQNITAGMHIPLLGWLPYLDDAQGVYNEDAVGVILVASCGTCMA